MQRFNDDDFQADLTAVPWDSAFVYDDIDDVWNHWSKLYKDTIDKHAPILIKRVRVKQLPWINAHIKKEIRRSRENCTKHIVVTETMNRGMITESKEIW